MAVTQELVAKFKADTADFKRKLDGVQAELDQTAQKTTKVQTASAKASRAIAGDYKAIGLAVGAAGVQAELDQIAQKTTKVQTASAKASRAIAGHYKAIGLAVGAAGVAVGAFAIKVGSDMQQAEKRIEAMLGSAKDAETVIKSLREAGQETGASVIGLANSFGKLATFVDNGILSLNESIKISKGLSSTALALGAGTEQLNQVMFGLSQALGSGTVRAEEFNQVTEPLPGIINRMEEAAGLASGELRQMINDGEVTSGMFKDLLIPAVQSFSKEAEQMATTLKAQAGILNNTLQAIGEDIFDYLESPLASATQVLNEFLQTLLSAERASGPEVQRRLNDVISRRQSLMQAGFGGRGGLARRNEFNRLGIEEAKLIAELQGRTSFDPAKPANQNKAGGRLSGRGGRKGGKGKTASTPYGGFGTDPIETMREQMDRLRQVTIEAGEESKSLADIMKDASSDAATAIEQNFIAMASGSSASFKDMARSMLQDINKIILRALVMRAVSGLANSFMGGAGGATIATGSQFNSLQGGAGSAGSFGMSGLGMGVSGMRANGGMVGAGRSYLVGERGPEILTMGKSGGFVTSNAQSGSAINNNGMTVHIDARGASAGVENKIRQVMQDVQGLRRQVPNIAVAAVREQNARKPDFLR